MQRGYFFYYRSSHKINDVVVPVDIHFRSVLSGAHHQVPEWEFVVIIKSAILQDSIVRKHRLKAFQVVLHT